MMFHEILRFALIHKYKIYLVLWQYLLTVCEYLFYFISKNNERRIRDTFNFVYSIKIIFMVHDIKGLCKVMFLDVDIYSCIYSCRKVIYELMTIWEQTLIVQNIVLIWLFCCCKLMFWFDATLGVLIFAGTNFREFFSPYIRGYLFSRMSFYSTFAGTNFRKWVVSIANFFGKICGWMKNEARKKE